MTKNQTYRERAISIAEHIEKGVSRVDGAWVWKYWDWVEDKQIEDISHGAMVVEFVQEMYHFGLYFKSTDIDGLVKTFNKKVFLSSDHVNAKLDGTLKIVDDVATANDETVTKEVANRWTSLAPADRSIVEKARAVLKPTPIGDGWRYFMKSLSDNQVAALAYGAKCSNDRQCRS